jgi:hypothetical protein
MPDVRLYRISNSDLSTNLNNNQLGSESANHAVTSWKMWGGKNNDGEITYFLGLDKAARVTTFEATGNVTMTAGTNTITCSSLTKSGLNATGLLYSSTFQQASTLFWSGSKLRVGSTTTPDYKIDIESTSQDNLRVINTNADANGPLIVLEKTSASPADDDSCGKIVFRGTNDDASVPEEDYGNIEGFSTDVSSNSTDGAIKIRTKVAGTMEDSLILSGGDLRLTNSTDDASHPNLILYKETTTPANNDGCGRIIFRATDDDLSVMGNVDFALIEGVSTDVSSSDPDGTLKLKTNVAGTTIDSMTIGAGLVTLKQYASQNTDSFEIVDSSDNELFKVWSTGHLTNQDGINTVASQYGVSFYTHNYGEGTPEHTNGVGSYDHTGGTYENLFTRTSGDVFTQADEDNGNFIVLIGGTNAGAVAEIKTYIDGSNVVVDGFNWTGDFASQSYYIYKHPPFVVGDGNITEVSAGTTGKFEIFGYNYTGEHVSYVKMTAAADSVEAMRYDVSANGYNLVDAIHTQYNTGDIQPGDLAHVFHVQIDETDATSADSTTDIQAMRLETTNGSSGAKCAMCIGPGFTNAIRIAGSTPIDQDYGYTVASGTVVDRVNNTSPDGDDSFISSGTNTTMFSSDNDYILIGHDATFEVINVNLATNSNLDLQLEFYYSKTGVAWVQFFPTDGTNGFTNSGNITFDAPAGWETDDEAEVNGDITNAYYIKILRTRNGAFTYPVEDYFKIFLDKDVGMLIRGDGVVQLPYLSAAPSSLVNGMMWMESDGLHIYYNSSEGILAP